MTFTSQEITLWLQPWPFVIPEGLTWQFKLLTLREASKLFIFWKQGTKRMTAAWWAEKAFRQTAPQEQHYIWMLALDRIPSLRSLTVLTLPMDERETVVEGNHQLVAALLAKRLNRCRLKSIAVLAGGK